MRILGITETCDLGSLYRRLLAAGHEVRVTVSEPLAAGTMANLVPRVEDWRAELGWIREAGDDGLILFEAVSEGFGALQDQLRASGFNVIGGSALGDRLENDRAFAQSVLADHGLKTAETRRFDRAAEAIEFLARRPGRYVLKHDGENVLSNYVGCLADGSDVAAYLQAHGDAHRQFILMEFVEGVEMGVGAYFDGRQFLRPACLDWEHKRFFAGDLGELTGEMGTVATFDASEPFFAATLGRLEPLLRDHGHVGYVNLNTIVNEAGIWPLEFTCRFGYPGYSVLEPLQAIEWGALLARMSRGEGGRFATRPGYCTAIVYTAPPFPYSRKEVQAAVGLPLHFGEALGPADWDHIHLGEVGMAAGRLVTSGLYGWTLVVTGTGRSIEAATRAAYRRIRHVKVPDGRYRLDIGAKLVAADLARVQALGLFAADRD